MLEFTEPELILNSEGNLYLTRHVLDRDEKDNAIFLNVIHISDDREMHDHPADFRSRIISGSYREYTPGQNPTIYTPGEWNIKKADQLHRLEILDGPVVTLMYRGPKYREWGFMTDYGWIHHSEFSRRSHERRGL